MGFEIILIRRLYFCDIILDDNYLFKKMRLKIVTAVQLRVHKRGIKKSDTLNRLSLI